MSLSKLSRSTIDSIVRMYKEGRLICEISEELGISVSTVYGYVCPSRNAKPRELSRLDIIRLANQYDEMLEKGLTLESIRKRLGLSTPDLSAPDNAQVIAGSDLLRKDVRSKREVRISQDKITQIRAAVEEQKTVSISRIAKQLGVARTTVIKYAKDLIGEGRRAYSRIPSNTLKEIETRLRSGESVRHISEAVGVSQWTIRHKFRDVIKPTRNKSTRKKDEATIACIRELYSKGVPTAKIAKTLNISYGTAKKYVGEGKIRSHALDGAIVERIQEMSLEGATAKQISKELGIAYNTAKKYSLREKNIAYNRIL